MKCKPSSKNNFLRRFLSWSAILACVCLWFFLGLGKVKGEPLANLAASCGNEVGNGSVTIPGPSGPSGADYDQVFRSLTVDPVNPDVVFVGTERNGIFRSTDGGKTWVWSRLGLRHMAAGYPEVWDIAIHPSGYKTAVFAATLDSPGPVTGSYPSSTAGVYKSTDGGSSWTRTNCGLTNSRAVSIRFDHNNPDTLILGIEGGTASFSQLSGQYFDGSLFRSTDGGANWNPLSLPSTAPKNGYWHLRAYGSTSTSFLTFGFNYNNLQDNLGFIRSVDSGANWSPLNTTLKNLLVTSFDVSADGSRIIAMERDAFTIQKSDDGGQTFTGISTDANGQVKISPADKDLVLFTSSGKLYRSTDGLATIDNNGQPVLTTSNQINDIEFSPSNPNIVYLAEVGYNIWKSTDSGKTFSLLVNLRTDVISKSSVRNDFDGNGQSDILWKNISTGQVNVWLMSGLTLSSSGSPLTVADLNWQIKGVGDFDGNGKSDILWKNSQTGMLYILLMNGLSYSNLGSPATVADLNWQIKGVGDFDGDGKSDILWKNSQTGVVYILLMNGLTYSSGGSPGTNASWQVKGVGDFDGDGKSDVLWKDPATGQVTIWLMNGLTYSNVGSPITVPDLNWQIRGVGDFDGDGKSDILWKNSQSGVVHILLMDGLASSGGGSPVSVPDLTWQIRGIGDFDGDGKSDILWKNSQTGVVYILLMNGLTISNLGSPATVSDLNWKIR